MMGLLREEKVLEYTKEGVAKIQVTVHSAPFFYRGPIPFVFQSGLIGNTRMVLWSQFKEFRVEYGFESERGILCGDIMASAVALNSRGEMLARAEVIELVIGSGFWIHEEHLSLDGKVGYSAKSFVGFDGQKQKESETAGTKEKEYFFIWPTGR